MKSKLLVPLLVGVLITGWASAVMAQQAESQLRLITEVHVKPGLVPQYEAAIKEAVAFRTENEFPFRIGAYVTEGLVYRYVAFLESWEDMSTNDQWYAEHPPPDFVPRLQEATDHDTRSFQRSRPALATIPDNPRLRTGEAGFFHEIRLYLRPGTEGGAAEILKNFSALYRQHDIQDGRVVWSQVSGSEGPLFALYFPARDAADYYAQRQKNLEMMGDEYQALQRQLAALCRRIEQVNWTIRRDLGYRPSN